MLVCSVYTVYAHWVKRAEWLVYLWLTFNRSNMSVMMIVMETSRKCKLKECSPTSLTRSVTGVTILVPAWESSAVPCLMSCAPVDIGFFAVHAKPLRTPSHFLSKDFIVGFALAPASFRVERFFKAPTGYPKKWLEYLCLMSYDISYVLWLMSYLILMSYDLCLMSHLMSDVICSHGFGLCLAFRT